MAEDGKQPGTILTIASIILVLLLVAGAYFFHQTKRLLSPRPSMMEASILEPGAGQKQKSVARLWQDPFAAIATSLDKSSQRDLEQRCLKKPSNESACNSPLTENDKDTLVIGVTVLVLLIRTMLSNGGAPAMPYWQDLNGLGSSLAIAAISVTSYGRKLMRHRSASRKPKSLPNRSLFHMSALKE